jgi:hypothetical protein
MSSFVLVLFAMAVGFSGGVVFASLFFAAKRTDQLAENDFKSLARAKSI